MKQFIREKFILEKLSKDEHIALDDIVKNFNVSVITARRDLNFLEKKGALVRTQGGAVVKYDRNPKKEKNILFSYEQKSITKKTQKEYIAEIAASFIEHNDIIFIDSGSTLFYLCRHLKKFNNLTIVTNSLPVIAELIAYDNIRVNIIGGEIDNERKAMYGMVAVSSLEHYFIRKAFIGADGVSLELGLTTYDEKEAEISRSIAQKANKVFLLCDSSKIENNSYLKFAPLSVVDTLITDSELSSDIKKEYESNGIKIIN